jgi:antirestriction protein ArdC
MNNIYQAITDKIVEHMEKGVTPWRKTWDGKMRIPDPALLPLNARTKKSYNGINVVLLWLAGRKSPYWATVTTWSQLKATVKPNETSTEIYFYENGKCLQTHQVYNCEQVNGCDLLVGKVIPDFGIVEQLLQATEAVVTFGTPFPFYDITEDIIYMPNRFCFSCEEAFYAGILHELGHWTGHVTRLRRRFGDKDDKNYAFEELVAELISCFAPAMLQIPNMTLTYHASYLSEWMHLLANDSKMVFRAAAKAQKATDYLLKFIQKGVPCIPQECS